MHAMKSTVYADLAVPQLKNNGAPVGATYVDTAGADFISFFISLGITDIAMTAAPQVTECDTTDGSYTAVTGAVLAAAPSATDDGTCFRIDVDLAKSHKRYMQCPVTAGNSTTIGTNLHVFALLSRLQQAPTTAALAGLAAWIEV